MRTGQSSKKKRDTIAIYAKIALDIAHRIVNGEIPEGKRLSGRSLMSSEYGVSSETIRRSFSLLEDVGVVTVHQNSGVVVSSKAKAVDYIAKFDTKRRTDELLKRMRELIEKHGKIEKELFDITRTLIDSTNRFTASNPFYTFEITVDANSLVAGNTLGTLQFWQKTHATVIAIRRDGSILLSPGPDLTLLVNDTLVLVGDHHARPLVEELVTAKGSNTSIAN